jgi:hypothetical protein
MKYRRPQIFRWKYTGFWPKKLFHGLPVIGVEDSEWALYLWWLEGY